MRKTKVSFISNNQNIAGTLLIPEAKTERLLPGVVFYHGRGSSQKGYIARAEAVAKKGIICLTFDFRGRGESEGEFSQLSIQDGIDDALAAFDFLARQGGTDKNRLGICGRSYGGYLAALVSGKREIKSLVLSAPAIYKDEWRELPCGEIFEKEYREFFNTGDFENNQAMKTMKRFKGNLYVIVNEKDEVVSENVVRAYYNYAIKAEHREISFIKGARHRLDRPEFDEQFKRLITDWFAKTL